MTCSKSLFVNSLVFSVVAVILISINVNIDNDFGDGEIKNHRRLLRRSAPDNEDSSIEERIEAPPKPGFPADSAQPVIPVMPIMEGDGAGDGDFEYIDDGFGGAQKPYRYLRPDYLFENVLNQILAIHNKVRANVEPAADQMLKMSWDYDLEGHAWEHTQECQFYPSNAGKREIPNFPRVGENLWVSWGIPLDQFNPEHVISTWLREKQYFDASLRSCIGGVCERYTQMVWLTSYKLGCAWSWCDNMVVHGFPVKGATFLACHYAPGGNDYPLVPYYHGQSCSFCDAEDTCEQGLCANPARDQLTGVPPFPTEPPTTTAITTTTPSLSEEAKIALIVVGSLAGSTMVLTLAIHIGVKVARRRAEGQLADYFKDIPRRLSLWYDKKRHSELEFNNAQAYEQQSRTATGKSHSRASIEYHANLWNE